MVKIHGAAEGLTQSSDWALTDDEISKLLLTLTLWYQFKSNTMK